MPKVQLRLLAAVCLLPTALVLLSCGQVEAAQTDQLEVIMQRLDALEQENRALKETVRQLQQQVMPQEKTAVPVDPLEEALQTLPAAEKRVPEREEDRTDLASVELGRGARLRLIDVSLDILVAAGTSSERDEVIKVLQGGGHDPKRRGFTLQQAELSLIGAVDPYFQAEAHILASEDAVELEEAFARTLSLPWGLELEAGYFLTEFGRINPTHPHAWIWMDQPVVNTRIFGGEGMRGAGMRVSKMLGTPWYSVLHAGVQNADGEFMASFLGGEVAHDHGHGDDHGEEGHDHEFGIGRRPLVDQEVRGLGDLVYLVRWENAFDLSSTWTTKVGLSGLHGPNFTGPDGETWIYGADFLCKWMPSDNVQGRPFFRLEGEFIKRDLRADNAVVEEDGEIEEIAGDTLRDWGFYLQGLYGFTGRWAAGLRYEYASGSGASLTHEGAFEGRSDDPYRDDRWRISPLVVFSPSEFSRLRLQYNIDDADHLDDVVHSVWLGLEVLIGAHPAHSY
ncbi:MAG: hypothetical protein R2940_14040 [Syntrophotaleaceae bacterium]